MKVAVDGRALMEGRQSGVQEYVRQLLRAMALLRGKDEIEVFVSGLKTEMAEPLPLGITVSTWRWPNKVLTSSQLLFKRPKWDSLIEADVFLAPNLQLLPLKDQTPLVAVAHDLSFEQFPEFLTLRRRLWHKSLRPGYFFEQARKVVAVSQHTKRDLQEWYGLVPEQIEVVYPGVAGPASSISPAEVQEMRQRYNLPERYILHLGAMEPRKNITGIVRAFEVVAKDFPHGLVLAGESGWRQGKIEQEILESSVRERIFRLGAVPEKDKWLLYAGADVLVYPSFYEGFGFPPLEALWCGTPVIVSVSSSLPEVVGEWATLVDPQAPGQLVLALREVLATGERVGDEVRLAIQERYSWRKAAEQMWSILRN